MRGGQVSHGTVRTAWQHRDVKLRRLRDGDVLDDGGIFLARGGELDPEVLHADAERYHGVYGSYGISVFALLDTTLEELAQQAPLVRFGELTLLTVDAVLRAGLRLEPTGRNPRHYTVAFDDLDRGVAGLVGCEHQVVPNPYHET
jgi:hypothetical protein